MRWTTFKAGSSSSGIRTCICCAFGRSSRSASARRPEARAPLRVAFAGTPAFAARALQSLIAAGHSVPLVLTQPDRPSGRGLRPTPSAVAEAARRHGLEVAQPATLKNEDDQVRLREL